MEKPALLTSSYDPQKWSLMVRGAIIGATSLILGLAYVAGVDTMGLDGEIAEVAEKVGDFVFSVGTFVGLGIAVVGAVRKVLIRFRVVKPKE